jgi:hypothetical protein
MYAICRIYQCYINNKEQDKGEKNMILMMLGAQGTGKGTVAGMLSEKTGWPQISTGDIFRKNISEETELGIEANKYIAAGNLVPDEITVPMVKARLEEDDAKDATPEPQAEFVNSFSIKVPSIASFNNADVINGNIYTWNIKKDEPTEIKLQYVQYSGFAIAFVILLGILLLVVLAGKILKHDAQKRVDNNDNIV